MNEIRKAGHSVARGADQANDVLESVKDGFAGLVEGAKDKGEELLAEAKEQGTKLWDKAQVRSQDAWKDTKVWITKHPGPAVGYAFLAGALLSAYFFRNDD